MRDGARRPIHDNRTDSPTHNSKLKTTMPLPPHLDATRWETLEPLYQDLLERPLPDADALERLLLDRSDLDDQLFGAFVMCRDLLRQTPQQADSREDLQEVLTRPSGGVVFTTIQKFAPERGDGRWTAQTG